MHATIAWGAIACNGAAMKIEIDALNESSRVVNEVNRLLGAFQAWVADRLAAT